ncbi:sensor histidine kinase [Tenacibaculum retecalamus]|uniref:sensor histidine kinase n=1 Tax=Tenacibaculum retecalamus TaxID=3018315 RepID=UPI0023D8F2E9|nr:HAMP domain-containing sensor histidine kinase [Tenacibaculum retecalamus]WBX70049.1 HAMP domain-containing sensor histidine kinase [Tenacibaculum retecalamus]
MGKPQFIQILIRVLLLIINGILVFFAYLNGYSINAIGFSFLFIFQLFLFFDYLKKLFADIEKSIDCLLHDDYSNTFSSKKRENPLHNKTALLLEKNRKKSLLKTSEALILTNIIESLSTGILILRKDTNLQIEVFQINKAFTEFLKIPKFYNWNLLKGKLGNLANFISKWEEVKHTISIDVNDIKESFFLKTSVTQTNQYEYLIISLETIQQLIDKKEKEAWYKLMNVMSHEIINTITPISSLAENLDSLLQEDQTDEETIQELSQGLQIIKRRSYHLTSFVDTYRKLAELPLPQKVEVDLTIIIKNTLTLFQQEFSSKNIKIEFDVSQQIIINADKQQIEQVLINLLSNCLYALVAIKNPKITIKLHQESNRINLSVIDNGIGISNDIKDNIFIPYFTTRKDGSGIGLTLSKSIMEAHNGTIRFVSHTNETCFKLTFINNK